MGHIAVAVYEALKIADVDDERVKAVAGSIPIAHDRATKSDIAESKAELKLLKFVYGPVVIVLLPKSVYLP